MALQKNYIKNIYGKNITFENSYIQIVSINGNKDIIVLQVFVYDNINKKNVIEQKCYSFTPSVDNIASNFIKQGYEYLKTLDEYKNTTDLLDEGQID